MKNILKVLIISMVATVVLSIAASAEPVVTYDVEETSTVGLYQIVATVSNDEGDFRVFANTVSFDFSTIKPSNYKGKATAIETSINSKAPLTVYTYTTSVYDPDLDEDVETTITADYAQAPLWTVDGDRASLTFETYKTPADLPTNDMAVFKMYFILAEGKTLEDFTSTTFTVDTIDWTSGASKFFYGQDAAGYTTNMSVINNVVPEAVAITIPVAAGDIVYLQDGSVVVMEEANAAYEVLATAGYVAVNTGKSAQKTYYVDGTTATEVHENAVVGSDSLTLRGPDELYNGEDRSGIRFKMTSSQSSRVAAAPHNVLEAGFLMTALSDRVVAGLGANPELTMDKVAGGLVLKGVAYDKANNIDIRMDSDDETINIIGVLYGIPVTEAGVQTKIISRPYYKVGDACIYGEATETTLYDVAVAIKGNDDSWAACSSDMQNYINTIIAQVVGWTEIVEDEIVIDISGLYN